MSYQYGVRSLKRLSECEPPLKLLMERVLEVSPHDITILCGARGKDEQLAAYKAGNSKLRWPKSKHNKTPSQAVDIAPWPIDWKDLNAFKEMAELVKATWDSFTIEEKAGWNLVWGGDWTTFLDYPHFELVLA